MNRDYDHDNYYWETKERKTMKKKIAVLLSSMVAGVGLVGATFAAWAVTDNANPMGIKVSPGTIQESTDAYSTMVLDWGDEMTFNNISNLKLGVANAQYLHVQVKSTVNAIAADTQRGGNLSLELKDLTESPVPGAPRLINNLVVEVYTTYTESVYGGKIDGLTLSNTTITSNADISTPAAGTAQDIYFKVYIPDSVSAVQYNQMTSDLVYFTIDWNKPSGVTPVSTQVVYYQSASGVPNCYAFKETASGVTKNANWPGVAMTVYDESQHIYQYTVNMSSFEKVIFSVGEEGNNQTDDLTIPALTAKTPYWNGTAWVAAPAKGEVANAQYYLVGTWNAWSTDGQEELTFKDGVASVEIQIPGNTKYEWKVKEATSNTWYSYTSTDNSAENCNWDNTTGSAVTITIRFSPTKTLNEGLQYVDAALKA